MRLTIQRSKYFIVGWVDWADSQSAQMSPSVSQVPGPVSLPGLPSREGPNLEDGNQKGHGAVSKTGADRRQGVTTASTIST